jgi:hypothetical protein
MDWTTAGAILSAVGTAVTLSWGYSLVQAFLKNDSHLM